MKKYQVTIHFEMSDEFMELVPPHRTYINYLINKDVIDQYAVSMESKRVWVTINAKNKSEVEELLSKSPLFKFWTFEIDELFVLDGQHYRLPAIISPTTVTSLAFKSLNNPSRSSTRKFTMVPFELGEK